MISLVRGILKGMKVKVKSLSPVRLLAIPWTAAHQASPPMGFSRQEYWSGLPLPSAVVYSTQHQKAGGSMNTQAQRGLCVALSPP